MRREPNQPLALRRPKHWSFTRGKASGTDEEDDEAYFNRFPPDDRNVRIVKSFERLKALYDFSHASGGHLSCVAASRCTRLLRVALAHAF